MGKFTREKRRGISTGIPVGGSDRAAPPSRDLLCPLPTCRPCVRLRPSGPLQIIPALRAAALAGITPVCQPDGAARLLLPFRTGTRIASSAEFQTFTANPKRHGLTALAENNRVYQNRVSPTLNLGACAGPIPSRRTLTRRLPSRDGFVSASFYDTRRTSPSQTCARRV